MTKSLALVGCGKMGQALLSGWLKSQHFFDISVIQPDPLPADFATDGFSYFTNLPEGKVFDIIVFAVKPQILDQVIKTYTGSVHPETLIISIAAGKNISTFESTFGLKQSIIRTMPNTPAMVGKGITALVANSSVTENQKQEADNLFKTCGETLWLKAEKQLDAITAVSGSGPAYLFYFIEALTKSAQELGLSEDHAMQLARQTVIGAASLAEHDSQTEVSTLRQNVTSPGGTTEAALNILMDGQLDSILQQALKAAKERSQELSN